MTAGCARCGACCDPVQFTRKQYEAVVKWTTAALAEVPDPADDVGWKHWQEHGWEDRDEAILRYAPGSTTRENADFLVTHWKPSSDKTCACDMYDRESGLCTAQDRKPPVCGGYPWYGREPDDGVDFPLQCSYLADLPRDQRPEGARPLIPLTVATKP